MENRLEMPQVESTQANWMTSPPLPPKPSLKKSFGRNQQTVGDRLVVDESKYTENKSKSVKLGGRLLQPLAINESQSPQSVRTNSPTRHNAVCQSPARHLATSISSTSQDPKPGRLLPSFVCALVIQVAVGSFQLLSPIICFFKSQREMWSPSKVTALVVEFKENL